MTSTTSSIRSYLGDVLWSQWAALGVPAATPASHALIDLEALLIATAIHTDAGGETRLRDGAISWISERHEYVATTRLKKLASELDPLQSDAVTRFTAQIAGNVPRRLTWAKVVQGVQAWSASTSIAPLPAWAPGALRLRARAIFGANAKAEAFAYLATEPGHCELALIERRVGYSRRQVDDALETLLDVGWVSRGTLGNRHTYALTKSGREFIKAPLHPVQIGPREVDQIPRTDFTWVDWSHRFQLLRTLVEVEHDLDTDNVIRAMATLQRDAHSFQDLFHPILQPIHPAESQDDATLRMREWLPDAARRVAGNAILP